MLVGPSFWQQYVFSYQLRLTSTEFLQDRLTQETTGPEFSEMPFRFAEIAKTLLDV